MNDVMHDRLDEIIEEYVRTHVTFRPMKVELHGDHLHWTFAPVFHEQPVVEDLSMYLAGDGAVLRGTVNEEEG